MFKTGILLLALAVIGCNDSGKKTNYVSIGTGGVTGVYYPVGGAIAKMINKHSKGEVKASAESTDGSVYNINAVLSGDLQFGISQSDRQYQAINNIAEWEKTGKEVTSNLRSVISLHAEAMTFLIADDTGIKQLSDLAGKTKVRINIGAMGSGTRKNTIDVLNHFGINYESDFKAEGLKSSESSKLLQDGRIDGFLFTVGHPSGTFKEATNGKRKGYFLSLSNDSLEGLITKYPYYAKTQIPIELYPQAVNKENVPTIGVVATLVTNAKVDANVVYNLVKSIFENFEQFKAIHPSLNGLTKESMTKGGLSAPLHEGAKKYFSEIGLL